MKVPLSWLREYVAVDVPVDELAARVNISVAEVERVVRRGVPDEDGNLGLYRIGRVVEADKHPNADRLQLCRVDVGESEPRQIVCGAWNFGAGATVAVALPGAVLPGGTKLERAKLRGTVSDGMILSERETTPNRPDLLAVYGVAREVAALYDLPLQPWPGSDPGHVGDEQVDVTIEDYEGCPR